MKNFLPVQHLRARLNDKSERGAALVLLAGATVVLMIVGAVAVDLSAVQTRAQTLQNTADAAALLGVVEWAETGDALAARALVDDLVAQNGTNQADVVVDVQFVDATTLDVSITDLDPQVFLSGFIPDVVGSVERGATATYEECLNPCGAVVPIPAPFLSINALGSGDGYRPTIVGTRLYGVNHHETTMACVDRLTQAPCFLDGALFPAGGYETDDTVTEGVVGTRIYYVGQNSTELRLFCWETLTDVRCPTSWSMGVLDGNTFRGGAVTIVDDQVYVVTDDQRMHCIRPATASTCPHFGFGGIPTGLSLLIGPLASGDAVGNNDRVVDDVTGRLYYTLKAGGDGPGYSEGTYIDCWDTTLETPCAGFVPSMISGWADKKSGRLFLYHHPRNPLTGIAAVGGVCSTDDDVITCFDLAGNVAPWMRAEMASLEPDMGKGGVHLYHPPTNRVVLQSGGDNLCWDFDAKTRCGSVDASATKDYGFTYEGNCIFALGHNSIFWAFSPDFQPECPGTSVEARIDKCDCAGVERWPNPTFELEMASFTNFEVLIVDPAGNAVWPLDGIPISIITHPTGIIDLSEVPTTHDYLIVKVLVELDPLLPDPWAGPDDPVFTLELSSRPHLSD